MDTWAPDEHYIPTLVRITVDSHDHVIQVKGSTYIHTLLYIYYIYTYIYILYYTK